MGAAAAAHNLRPLHAEPPVHRVLDLALVLGGVKARPSAARIELGLGVEQFVAATDAQVNALVMEIPILAGKCALGALFARDLVLLWGEKVFPFLVGLDDLRRHRVFPPTVAGRHNSSTS